MKMIGRVPLIAALAVAATGLFTAVVVFFKAGEPPAKPQTDKLVKGGPVAQTYAGGAVSNALAANAGEKAVQPGPVEKADIIYNFQGMPVMQAIDLYENLIGEKVAAPATGWPRAGVSLVTPGALTVKQAKEAMEKVLAEQAHLGIRRDADGSLRGVMLQQP